MPVPNASLTPDETVQWSPSGPAALALTTSGALRAQRPRGPLVLAGTANLHEAPIPQVVPGTTTLGWYWWSSAGTSSNNSIDSSYHPLFDKWIRHEVVETLGLGQTWLLYARKLFDAITNVTLTISMHVATTRPRNATFQLRTVINGTQSISTSTTIAIGISPERVSLTCTVPEGSTLTSIGIGWVSNVSAAGVQNGDVYWLSGAQVELGDTATPFVDPDDPDTYWIAAANNSPSVRPDRYAELPLGWFVEDATTNYDSNPISASVVHPFNGYTHISGSRITNAQLGHPTAGVINTAARMTLVSPLEHTSVVGTTAGSAASLGYSIAVGAVATQQIWFRASPKWIGRTVYVAFSKIGGTGQSITKPVIVTGDWQYVDLTLTVTIEGGTAFYVYINSEAGMIGDASMVGEWIDFTATQLEQKSYATSLAVHTMGTGYSLGANNVIVRAVATPYVTLPMPADQGSIYIRYLAGTTPTSRYTGGFGQIGGVGARALIPNISSSDQMNLRQGQDFHGLATVSDWNQIRGVYAEYNGNQVAVDYRDGVGKRYFTRQGDPPPPTWNDDRIPIGWSGNNSSPSPLNGYVFAIVALPRPLTEDEIAALESIPTEDLSYASIVGIGPQLGGLLLTHPDPGFAVLRTHGGT